MQNLDEKAWKPIPMTALFQKFVRGKVSSASDELKCSNGIPYVGATDRNNGVLDYLEADRARIQPGNCITFIRDGQGSVGSSIYRATPCIATVNTSSGYASWLNQNTGLFVSTSSNQVRGKYGFGYKRKEKRLLAERIMLPITHSGEPDYEYMAEYTRQKREAMLEKYRAYVEERIAQLGGLVEIPALGEKEWIAFHLEKIGTVTSGRDIYAAERIEGDMPYITSGGTNNGVGYFVGNSNETLDSGYIALNRNGAVGKAFYHSSKSLMGNDCRKVHLKNADNNLFVGQFVALCISMQSECFSYSRKLGTARAKRMQIMLPVTDSGEPDYEYMEQYAKNMMLRKYQQYLAFLAQSV